MILETFTRLASWVVYELLELAPDTRLADALHFFIEDVTKIFALLLVMIYLVAWLRASLDVERVRQFLKGRHPAVGYVLGSLFGAVTPFCSCSSIPVFLGFTSAGIPIGVTMAFLLTSPLINEVAVVVLLGLMGWEFTLVYIGAGLIVGISGGLFLDRVHAEQWLQPFAAKAYNSTSINAQTPSGQRLDAHARHHFALSETRDIFSRVWKWVFIGVGLGAALHGFVPAGWFEQHLAGGQWWTVPTAVLAGIPLYSNATGVIPVMETLITKGLPVGTTLAFCMSTVAASFPEFILLKQVMQWRLLVLLFVMLLVAFTLIGWVFNSLF